MSILVVGSCNTDMIVKTDRIPRPGETVLGGKFSMAAGGKGANQAVAAARAGGDVKFVARVGNDLFGQQAVEGFKADAIDTAAIKTDMDSPSGVALICVDGSGENSITVAPGANNRLSPDDIREAGGLFPGADVVLVQLETPLETVETVLDMAVKNKVPVVLNPAPAQQLADALLAEVSIITPNETEAEILTGIEVMDESSAARAARVLRSKGIQTVIITLGARGAFVMTDAISETVPSFPVDAVDTTAAGDTFNGFLVARLAQGKGLLDAVQFANAAAALSVTRAGAQPSIPTHEMVEAFLAGSGSE